MDPASDWHAVCSKWCIGEFGGAAEMFRLDYLSCLLTVVATILVGRKKWTGLLLSGVNSAIVCVIGVHTSQYGFIPANMFCMCIYALNIRRWRKMQKGSPSAEPSCRPYPMRQPVLAISRANVVAWVHRRSSSTWHGTSDPRRELQASGSFGPGDGTKPIEGRGSC